jgi:diguanylate cyclase (GGDEF)-like protein
LREAGKPLAVEDAQNSEYVSREVVAEIPAQSLLGVPIYTYQENVFWGAVIISYNRQHHFYQEEIQRAQQVADIVALLITRACLYQETIVRAEMLREFSTHVTQLTSDLQHTSLLPAIVESARSLMKAQRAALFLYNKELDQLTCAHAIALSKEYIKGIKKNYKDVPGGLILRGQLSVLVPDVNQDPHLKSMQNLIKREGFKAYAVFSLQSPDQELGALAVYWDQTHNITSPEVAIARLFAERAGALLHSAFLYAQITELSQTDPLTNLPNRRALAARLIDEANRTSRFEHPFTLIMMDLDGFKSINDTYGHSAGDNALKQIADAISRGLRGTDFISRYGGDEFALILPGTSKQTALTVTGKLNRTLENCDLDLPAGAQEHVSACMGLAGFPEDTNDADKLIEISDRRLYRAKNIQAGTIIDSDM